MARRINRLSARGVQTKRKPGYYPDGAGLYLQVSATGTKSWVFRFMLNAKAREMGLGSALTFSLEEVRGLRDRQRKLLAEGKDPIEARKAERAHAALELAQAKTFKDCAVAYIEAHRAGWKNAKHREQWENTLSSYAYPTIGALPVQAVYTGHVREVLQPIWNAKRETAVRLRGRIEKILDWATALGYRAGLNPARWRGHLDKVLAKDQRRRRIQHHPAMSIDEIGSFMPRLRQQECTAASALEFLILTTARTGEVIGMQWPEVNLDAAVWTVPAERMKGHREHRVPLSPAAVKLLRALLGGEVFIFPGRGAARPLSNMAMLKLLERMGHSDLTVHGFRSTFRDWAAERTSFAREVCEMALAHAIADETEAAYRRGDLFEKRRRLMDAWAAFVSMPVTGERVLSIKRAA
jgi:integrase